MNQVESVKQGNRSALDTYPELNELKKSLDGLRKEIKPHTISEADKYDKREQIIRGNYEIKIITKKRYSYSHDEEIQRLTEALKERQELMKKAATMNAEIVDDNGEVIPEARISYSTYPQCIWVGDKQIREG